MKQVLKIFFGICFLLLSIGLLLFNLCIIPGGFDSALLLPNTLLFFAGLLLTVFGISSLPKQS